MAKKVEFRKNRYFLLHPMRVVLVASRSPEGKKNVMSAAWCMPVNDDPFMVALALGSDSVTARNIRKTGEFTLNVPGQSLLKSVKMCGSMHGDRIDKARKAGLSYEKGRTVMAPIIEECMAHLECRVWKTIPSDGVDLFIGDVKAAYADPKMIRKVWEARAKVLLHLGGNKFAIPKSIE
ncbi:MAG: flavin reductase family protein [Candidatus Micrarchaeia archaeon]